MFLVNRSNAMICARAMELFGFGVGTFSELTEGPVAHSFNFGHSLNLKVNHWVLRP